MWLWHGERASLSTHNDAEEINCKKTVLMEKRWTGCGYGALGYASVELGGELVEIGCLAGWGTLHCCKCLNKLY